VKDGAPGVEQLRPIQEAEPRHRNPDSRVIQRPSELPHRATSDEHHDGGRGLAIVDAFSQQWGCTVVRGASGKSVWFTMGRGAGREVL
jgi:hypothetical protein